MFFHLVTAPAHNDIVETWPDEELEALVAWLREPFFFLREAPCDEDSGDDSGEDFDDGR